jgi:hypothetical protein
MMTNKKIKSENDWGTNARLLLRYLGEVNHFEVCDEYQVDPQMYISKGGAFSHLYTDSRRVDLVWCRLKDEFLRPLQKEFPFFSNEIELACEIEASFDTKRIIQSVNNLERLNAGLGLMYLVLSTDIAKDIEKALSCLHVARLRLSTPIIVLTDLEVLYLYSLLNNDWKKPNDPFNTYVDVLKRKYEEKKTTNPDQVNALKEFWEKALRGDKETQFFMNTPDSFRQEIRKRLSSFLDK